MFCLILLQLVIFIGSIIVVIQNDLLKLSNLDSKDYFDQNDIETLKYFTESEIERVFKANEKYVDDYLKPYPKFINATYDEIIANSTLTNFYGAYQSQINAG